MLNDPAMHVLRLRHILFRLLKAVLSPLVRFSSLLTRAQLLLRKPRWHVGGRCEKCGRCCELLAMSLPGFAARLSFLRQIVRWYYEENYSMHFEGFAEDRWLLFSCPNLDAGRLCSIYKRRPRICRQYPADDGGTPPDIPSYCGFKIDATGRDRL